MRPDRALGAVVVATVLSATAWGCAAGTPVARQDEAETVTTSAPPAPSSTTTSSSSSPVTPARRARSVVTAQAPRSATLPSGRTVPVSAVGTTADGLLAVPDDIDVAGWWQGGARLGDPFGSILVAAHVDSRTQGLGPFAELLTATPGQRIRAAVRRAPPELRDPFPAAGAAGRPRRRLVDLRRLWQGQAHPGDVCAALRRGAGRLPEPGRGDGATPRTTGEVMSPKKQYQTRLAGHPPADAAPGAGHEPTG